MPQTEMHKGQEFPLSDFAIEGTIADNYKQKLKDIKSA